MIIIIKIQKLGKPLLPRLLNSIRQFMWLVRAKRKSDGKSNECCLGINYSGESRQLISYFIIDELLAG